LWSLVLLIIPFIKELPNYFNGGILKSDTIISGIFGMILLGLSFALIIETFNTLVLKRIK